MNCLARVFSRLIDEGCAAMQLGFISWLGRSPSASEGPRLPPRWRSGSEAIIAAQLLLARVFVSVRRGDLPAFLASMSFQNAAAGLSLIVRNVLIERRISPSRAE